jgi:hypothetical protein
MLAPYPHVVIPDQGRDKRLVPLSPRYRAVTTKMLSNENRAVVPPLKGSATSLAQARFEQWRTAP